MDGNGKWQQRSGGIKRLRWCGGIGRWHWEQLQIAVAALGGGGGGREHATMVLVSALLKLRAYYYNVGVSIGEDKREEVSDVQDVCWQR